MMAQILKDNNVLIEVKATLRLEDTLVPLNFFCDGTQLLNFGGAKKVWPVYMTIGNLSSKIGQMPVAHTIIMVSLLPIPIKTRNIPYKEWDKQQKTKREVLKEVMRRVLQPLKFKPTPNAESGYFNFLCADGNFRHCKLVLAALLADCPEYSDLNHLERHVCFWLHCLKNKVGDYVPDLSSCHIHR